MPQALVLHRSGLSAQDCLRPTPWGGVEGLQTAGMGCCSYNELDKVLSSGKFFRGNIKDLLSRLTEMSVKTLGFGESTEVEPTHPLYL